MKVAIVTGGGSGIGFAMADKFVRGGYQTIIVGKNEEKLRPVVSKLGESVSYEVCDLSSLETIPSFD